MKCVRSSRKALYPESKGLRAGRRRKRGQIILDSGDLFGNRSHFILQGHSEEKGRNKETCKALLQPSMNYDRDDDG